jgi:hypothetical protein
MQYWYSGSKDDADEKKCILSQMTLYFSLSLLLAIHQWLMIKNDFQTQPKYYTENCDSFSKNHQTTVSEQALSQWVSESVSQSRNICFVIISLSMQTDANDYRYSNLYTGVLLNLLFVWLCSITNGIFDHHHYRCSFQACWTSNYGHGLEQSKTWCFCSCCDKPLLFLSRNKANQTRTFCSAGRIHWPQHRSNFG